MICSSPTTEPSRSERPPVAIDGSAPDSVVVLRLSSVGDIVLTEPVIAALRERFPAARIGFAVKKRFRDLVAAHPAIDRVHELDASSRSGTAALVAELREARYSTVVDLHRNVRTVRIARSSRIPRRLAYEKRELSDALRVRVLRRPFRARIPLVRRYLDALLPLGIEAPMRRPRLYVDPADAEAGDALLERHGLSPGRFAAVVPGSVWATKRWPSERFAALAGRLVAERGLPVLLLGSASERGLCDEVARSAGDRVRSAAGESTLGQLAAVISRARLFVGNDSGPTHIAMAAGVPTVALFGPTDPGQFDFGGGALVYRDLDCSACSFYGSERCHLGHWDCMLSISADDVMGAASGLLEREGSS
jgi:lipopolysaccharide heptosyltransferase II